MGGGEQHQLQPSFINRIVSFPHTSIVGLVSSSIASYITFGSGGYLLVVVRARSEPLHCMAHHAVAARPLSLNRHPPVRTPASLYSVWAWLLNRATTTLQPNIHAHLWQEPQPPLRPWTPTMRALRL